MGIFKKLFDKKECSICGGEIGLLGNRKLEDGNCCKECAAKLSPWFDERRHSTVDQIKQQLDYREQNRVELGAFRPTVAYGDGYYTLRAEVVNGVPTRFVIERGDNYLEENADLVNFRDVTSFEIDVDEHKRELKRKNNNGEEVSYIPPRFEYSYDFNAVIRVNHPYFDDMRFKINRNSVDLETVVKGGTGRFQFGNNDFDPMLYPEYREYRNQCDRLEELFREGMQGSTQPGYTAPVPQPESAAAAVQEPVPQASRPKFCQNCGAPYEGGKFCQSCGSPL